MEFVIATFPRVRGIRVDGAPQGQTGQLIGVQRGHHIFDLGNPKDYVPVSVPATVMGTSQAQPMVIPFQPVTQAAGAAPAATRRGAPGAVPPAPEVPEVTAKAAMRATKSAKKRARKPANEKKSVKTSPRARKRPIRKGGKQTQRAKAERDARNSSAPKTSGPKRRRIKKAGPHR